MSQTVSLGAQDFAYIRENRYRIKSMDWIEI